MSFFQTIQEIVHTVAAISPSINRLKHRLKHTTDKMLAEFKHPLRPIPVKINPVVLEISVTVTIVTTSE